MGEWGNGDPGGEEGVAARCDAETTRVGGRERVADVADEEIGDEKRVI